MKNPRSLRAGVDRVGIAAPVFTFVVQFAACATILTYRLRAEPSSAQVSLHGVLLLLVHGLS
jgi:hypothetical protein